eukprot:1281571-Pyramimonas_sp.AAC.1
MLASVSEVAGQCVYGYLAPRDSVWRKAEARPFRPGANGFDLFEGSTAAGLWSGAILRRSDGCVLFGRPQLGASAGGRRGRGHRLR